MEDNFTSTVDGAMGFAKMHAEKVSKHPEGYDPYYEAKAKNASDEADSDEYEQEHECNCSDPGCPCGGRKIGSV